MRIRDYSSLSETNMPRRAKTMEKALEQAVKAYAEMANMTEAEVLKEVRSGNEVVTRSVQMLLFVVA